MPQAPAAPGPGVAAPAGAGGSKMPAATIAIIVVIAVLGAGAAAFMLIGDGAVGDCALQYRYEGVVRHPGWTQGECNQWCAENLEPAGRAIDCWFDAY